MTDCQRTGACLLFSAACIRCDAAHAAAAAAASAAALKLILERCTHRCVLATDITRNVVNYLQYRQATCPPVWAHVRLVTQQQNL